MAKWDAHAYKAKCDLLSEIFDPVMSAMQVSNKLNEALTESAEKYFKKNLRKVQVGVQDSDGFVFLL